MQTTKIHLLGEDAPHARIKADILDALKKGRWRVGDAFPTESALAANYKVSRITIRKALKGLEEAGILVPRQGAGRIVVRIPDERRRSKTIGVVCGKYGPSYGEIEYIRSLAASKGYSLHQYLLNAPAAPETLNRQLKLMDEDGVSGIVVLCRDMIGDRILEWKRSVPVVAVYQNSRTSGIPTFDFNWRWMGFEVGELLLKNGAEKVFVLLPDMPEFKNLNEMIYEGIDYAFHHHGMALAADDVFFISSSRKRAHAKSLKPVFERLSATATTYGIFSYWHWTLKPILDYFGENSLKIPDDAMLITAVDHKAVEQLGVTAFKFDLDGLLASALNLLFARMEEGERLDALPPPRSYGELIKRKSTGDDTRGA